MEERKRRRKLCLSPVPVDQDPPASSFTPASSLSYTDGAQGVDYASRQRIEGDVSDATLRRELMEMKGILNSIYQVCDTRYISVHDILCMHIINAS